MAVTQYIGARYVPKFYENSLGTSEWQSGVIYEPLTIVTYNTNSYTSKKTVPANIGNPSDNQDYWVATGVFNAQLAQVLQDLADIREEIATMDERKIVFIGDSYMAAHGLATTSSFARLAGNAMGLVENTDYWISAVDGYGFARAGLQFVTLLNNIIVGVDDSEITDVVVCGGANDSSVVSGIRTAIQEFGAACKSRFPNAKITLGFCDWALTGGYSYRPMVEAWRKGSVDINADFIDGFWMPQHGGQWKQSDGHPNNAGQVAIAEALVSWLVSGSMVYPTPGLVTATLTGDQDGTLSGSYTIYSSMAGQMCSLSMAGAFDLTLTTPLVQGAGGFGTSIKCGTIGNSMYNGTAYPNFRHYTYARITKSDDTTIFVPAYVGLQAGVFFVSCLIETAMTIKAVRVYSFDMTDNCFNC